MTSITFKNSANLNAGIAIVAMNVVGCIDCANGALAQINNLGGGTGATISTTGTGGVGRDLEWSVAGGVPGAPGAWLIRAGITASGLRSPRLPSTLYVDSPILFNDALDANGESTFALAFPAVVNQALCGFTVVAQHGTIGLPPCLFSVSDALAITIGNDPPRAGGERIAAVRVPSARSRRPRRGCLRAPRLVDLPFSSLTSRFTMKLQLATAAALVGCWHLAREAQTISVPLNYTSGCVRA